LHSLLHAGLPRRTEMPTYRPGVRGYGYFTIVTNGKLQVELPNGPLLGSQGLGGVG
jgi:hypothetical protein